MKNGQQKNEQQPNKQDKITDLGVVLWQCSFLSSILQIVVNLKNTSSGYKEKLSGLKNHFKSVVGFNLSS